MNSGPISSRNGRNLDGLRSTQVDVFGDDFLPLPPTWNRLFRRKAPRAPADLRPLLDAPEAAHGDCLWHFTGGVGARAEVEMLLGARRASRESVATRSELEMLLRRRSSTRVEARSVDAAQVDYPRLTLTQVKPWADPEDDHWTARLWRPHFPACCAGGDPPPGGCGVACGPLGFYGLVNVC